MIIDTHCHYNLDTLHSNWEDHWQLAQSKGVAGSIIVGTSVATSQIALTQASTQVTNAKSENRLFAAVGIHPNSWQRQPEAKVESEIAVLSKLMESNTAKVIAIGETGLDYFRQDKTTPEFDQIKKTQLAAFEEQLQLAILHQLPLILHVRDHDLPDSPIPNNAYWDTLALLKRYQASLPNCILHCVSGPKNYIQEMVDLGAYAGLAGNITYKSAQALRDVIKSLDKNRLLLETDAPYLPPQEFRGKPCEPWMISLTASFVYDTFQVTPGDINNNTARLFPQFKHLVT